MRAGRTIIVDDSDRIRNNEGEVLLDLSKFEASREEIYRLRREIERLNRASPWRKWSDFALMLNNYRIFPRLFFGIYMFVFLYIVQWFVGLTDPSGTQVTFATGVLGLSTAVFGLYVSKGNNHPDQPGE